MLPLGAVVIVLLCLGIVAIGVAYVARPQLMFRVYNFPTGSSGDHLTAAGERAYRRQGIGIVGFGVLILLGFLYLLVEHGV